ncbi:NAD(P)-dependent oxidoreductase [Mycolicibacterium lutetiense]|uniref:3-hydroxyisobutyrate dehydrogenase-like beta-hydroxyacid dehydrogenase n=1 Tax=Mycolicibacterium lutetiense TaxID=1641992 RepID=A0ABS4ZPF2_9MYCO|nr:NAD(P)-dependent oxidoreductase [Mycolicibacterium lutetiense]MBP2451061.1 3-hydroxyisobutyrate dehydrogenase-like beta-hydroxyacid dehydrogenase [Mycolicibacterium lutetiense]
MRVGFIGAGRMGAPMVRRLADAGHQVRALGRDDEKRAAVAELGAEPVASPREAVSDAEVAIVCVFTDEQVRDLCPDLIDEMPEGAVLVLHTTGSPRTVEALAERGAARGIAVIDAPVSGGPHDIAAGSITVFAGGAESAVARARAVLKSYADPVLHVGPVGAGQRVKLVNNALFAAQIGAVAEGVKLGDRLGIDEATLLTALTHGSGASRALGAIAATGSADAFIARVGEFIGKDVAVVRTTASELDSNLGRLEGLIDAAVT